jgi:hypothetical protein
MSLILFFSSGVSVQQLVIKRVTTAIYIGDFISSFFVWRLEKLLWLRLVLPLLPPA